MSDLIPLMAKQELLGQDINCWMQDIKRLKKTYKLECAKNSTNIIKMHHYQRESRQLFDRQIPMARIFPISSHKPYCNRIYEALDYYFVQFTSISVAKVMLGLICNISPFIVQWKKERTSRVCELCEKPRRFDTESDVYLEHAMLCIFSLKMDMINLDYVKNIAERLKNSNKFI
eukprot:490347_1